MSLRLQAAPVVTRRTRRTRFQRNQDRLKLLEFETRKYGSDWRLDCYLGDELSVVVLGPLAYVAGARWYISSELAKGRAMSVIKMCLPQAIGGKVAL